MLNIINTFFLTSFGATTIIAYKIINGAYNFILFGIENPFLTIGCLYGILILIYVFLFSIKIIAKKVCDYIFNENNVIAEKVQIIQNQNKNTKTFIDYFISFLQLAAGIFSCFTTMKIAIQELQSKDIIDLSKDIVFTRVFTMEDKLQWLSYLRYKDNLKFISNEEWLILIKNVPWQDIKDINELKTYFAIEYTKLCAETNSIIINEKTNQNILSPILNFIYNHPLLIIIGALICTSIIYFVYMYYNSVLLEINNNLTITIKQVNEINNTIVLQSIKQNKLVTACTDIQEKLAQIVSVINELNGKNIIIDSRLTLVETTLQKDIINQSKNILVINERFGKIINYVNDLKLNHENEIISLDSGIKLELNEINNEISTLKIALSSLINSNEDAVINIIEQIHNIIT